MTVLQEQHLGVLFLKDGEHRGHKGPVSGLVRQQVLHLVDFLFTISGHHLSITISSLTTSM